MKQNLARNLYEEKTGEGVGRSVAARQRVSPTEAGSCPEESLVQMSRLRYTDKCCTKRNTYF